MFVFRYSVVRNGAIALSMLMATSAMAGRLEAQPKMIEQSEWVERSTPFRNDKMQAQPPGAYKGLVIHNTDTLARLWSQKSTIQKMRDYHDIHLGNSQRFRQDLKGQPWGGFAYHFLIDLDGRIAKGRDIRFQGDSGTDYDLPGRLLIVLEGKFEGGDVEIPKERLGELAGKYRGEPRPVADKPDRVVIDTIPDKPTKAQLKSLDALAIWLNRRHKLRSSAIVGHRDLAPGQTNCPGETLAAYVPRLKQLVAKATGR